MTDQQTTGSPKNNQDLWDYFAQNHSLSLLESELSDIRHTVSATQESEIRSCHNQINALRAENERLKAQLACDACDGSGTAISGPCGCRGRGINGMVTTLREQLYEAQCQIEELSTPPTEEKE